MAERQFGPYRLVRQIAVGGMAEIHLAKTKGIAGFEKYVALKMIHPNFAEDDHFIEMLVDEAKLTALLRHHNIAKVYEFSQTEHDEYFMAMEYVDGQTLGQVVHERGPLPVRANLLFSPSWGTVGNAPAAALLGSWAAWLGGRGLGDDDLRVGGLYALLEAEGDVRYNTAVTISAEGKLLGKYHKQRLDHEAVRNSAGASRPLDTSRYCLECVLCFTV